MSARDRAEEVLARLPDGEVIGAEIGVFGGRMSKRLLARPGLTLHMVDNWKAMPKYRVSQETQDWHLKRCLDLAQEFYGRAYVWHGDSAEQAEAFQDCAFDFVFIDADHSYEGVKNDIEAWYPKLKPSGFIGGHDYANKGEPCGMEVKRAVDEMAEKLGRKVVLGGDSTWFYR